MTGKIDLGRVERVIRLNQQRITALVFVQYAAFLSIISAISQDDSPDRISQHSAMLICLGVVGLGVAKFKATQMHDKYSEAYTITYTYLGILKEHDLHSIQLKTDADGVTPEQKMNSLENVVKFLDEMKISINKLMFFVWFSELLFITSGTLYGGFGSYVLTWIHG